MTTLKRIALLLTLLSVALPIHSAKPPYLVVLGVAQDGGYPHPGCRKPCCQSARRSPALARRITCLALVNPGTGHFWLIEAPPDLGGSLAALPAEALTGKGSVPAGIFLTHAHLGHYTGLLFLGREAMNTRLVPVFAMPRLADFLRRNGPWSLLLELQNIAIQPLTAGQAVPLEAGLEVTPFLVPHRDELSETVGYRIRGSASTVLFIPDIDKWEKWPEEIVPLVKGVDVAFLDGTFYDQGEVPGRDMSEIPHPFIRESIERLSSLGAADRAKVHFIHFNHTNPLLRPGSAAQAALQKAGFRLARQGQRHPL